MKKYALVMREEGNPVITIQASHIDIGEKAVRFYRNDGDSESFMALNKNNIGYFAELTPGGRGYKLCSQLTNHYA